MPVRIQRDRTAYQREKEGLGLVVLLLGLGWVKGFSNAGAGIMNRDGGRGDGPKFGWRPGQREGAVEAVLWAREGV